MAKAHIGFVKVSLITRGSAHWACIAHLTIEWYWKQISKGDNHYLKKTVAILNGGWGCRTQFWKGHTQGSTMPGLDLT